MLILVIGASSDFIIKVIKPLYNVLVASINHLPIYYPNYKVIFNNPTRTFVYIANCFILLYYWSNLLTAFVLIYNNSAYIVKLDLVTKKKNCQKFFYSLRQILQYFLICIFYFYIFLIISTIRLSFLA